MLGRATWQCKGDQDGPAPDSVGGINTAVEELITDLREGTLNARCGQQMHQTAVVAPA